MWDMRACLESHLSSMYVHIMDRIHCFHLTVSWTMSIQVIELLDKVKKERERKERREIQPNESTTSLADDVGAEDDFEDEEEDEVVRAQVKRKSKVKFSASATSRKLVEEEDDINWDSDEFKDLNFGEDENIIFIK